MPRGGQNKASAAVKRRYFVLIRQGVKGAEAARRVGVSTSCGSLWFLDAGGVIITERGPNSARFLDQDERIGIADGLHAHVPVPLIAQSLGRGFQTVYREIERNSKPDGSYQPFWAHNQALSRRKRPKKTKLERDPVLRRVVRKKLDQRWSPAQISRFLTRSYAEPDRRLCAETIYRALFCGLLGARSGKLRTGRSCRKAQRRGVAPPNKIKDMRLLDQRPAEVTQRQTPGNWEGDLIIGAKMGSAIGTLVERVTRFVVLIHLPCGYKAPQLRDALIAQTAHLPAVMRQTLTWDQGREMALHAQTSVATGFKIFFCDPHSPWQRGTNENTNGLLRQYFPKHTDLSGYTAGDLRAVARELNNRPRLVLGDATPREVMRRSLSTVDIR
jgi:transposase, IS30 family